MFQFYAQINTFIQNGIKRMAPFLMNVAIQSVKIKAFRANADVWTPVFYFYGINRIGSLI